MTVEDLCPLSAETCTLPNSESREVDVAVSSLQKKKRKNKKRSELENGDKICERPLIQALPVQLSKQKASHPLREKDIKITELGSPQSHVELNLSTKKKKKKKGCERSEIDTSALTNATSPQTNVDLSLSEKKKKKKKGSETSETNDTSALTNAASPQTNVDLSLFEKNKKKKKKKKKKGSETSEIIDTSCGITPVQPQPVLSNQEAVVAPQPLTKGTTTITHSDSQQSNVELSLPQNTNKKRTKKKVSKIPETNDEEVEVSQPIETVQPELIQVIDQKIEAPQPIEDLSFSTKSKKRIRKKSHKSHDTRNEVCSDSVATPVMESSMQAVDPCTQPSAEMSLHQLVEGISTMENSNCPNSNADFGGSQETKKKKRKRSHKNNEDKDLPVETTMSETNPSCLTMVSEKEAQVSEPLNVDAQTLVEGTSRTTDSENPGPDTQETKKKKRKRGHKKSDCKELLVEVIEPKADPSLQPLLAMFSEHELEVPPTLDTDAKPTGEGLKLTMNSESLKPNGDISCSQETKKKKRKRVHNSSDSKELSVEVMEPEADPSLQPMLAIFSEHELEVPPALDTDAKPTVEGLSMTKNAESPYPVADINCTQETKKKKRKKRCKTSETEELLVEVTIPAPGSLQPIISEKELEVPQPVSTEKELELETVSEHGLEVPPALDTDAKPPVEGLSVTVNSEISKPSADISCSQETKKKRQRRKCKASETDELLVGVMTPEAGPSLQAILSEKELDVSQPLTTDAEPVPEGMSTVVKARSPQPSSDISLSQETKKKSLKRKHKTSEIMMPEADQPLQPSPAIQEVEVLPVGTDAQPLLDGVHIETSDIPEPSATLERSHLSSQKKLLILDINGLLADIVQMEVSIPSNFKPDKIISRKAVFKRPFCDDFLQFCFDRFNVGVWSSRTKINVDIFIDYLLGDSKSRLLFCWNQSHCTSTRFKTEENKNKPLVLKELRKLWEHLVPGLPWARGEYNESNTLLLDDSPYKALRNPVNTAIFPVSYQFRNREDSSLGPGGDIRSYLEGLATAENVQKYVEQHPFGQQPITESNPSWNFYIEDDASPQANNVPVSIVDESAPLAASVTEPEPAQAPEPVVVEEPATVVPEDPILVVVDPSDIEEEPVIEDEVAIVEPPVPSIQSRDIPEVDPIPESQEDAPKKSYASIVKIMKSSVTSSPVRVVRPRTVSANTAHPSPGSVKPALPPVASTPSGDAAPESSDAHEEAEGHSIHVRNLPYDATVEQLEIEFKKFGLIKQDGIQVRSSKQGFCFGFVEFESVTAMQNALQASPIKIGDRQAVIEEKRTTTKVSNDGRGRFSSGRAGFRSDSFRGGRGNYGGSRSFGRNEFRNQGEFSRSKSSVGRNEEGYQRANPNGRGGGRQGPANTRTSVPT